MMLHFMRILSVGQSRHLHCVALVLFSEGVILDEFLEILYRGRRTRPLPLGVGYKARSEGEDSLKATLREVASRLR